MAQTSYAAQIIGGVSAGLMGLFATTNMANAETKATPEQAAQICAQELGSDAASVTGLPDSELIRYVSVNGPTDIPACLKSLEVQPTSKLIKDTTAQALEQARLYNAEQGREPK